MIKDGFNLKGLGIFIVVLFIFLFMLCLQCCLDKRTTKKVIKRRPRSRATYRDISETVSHSAAGRPRGPIETLLPVIDYTDIDGIVVISGPEASPVVVPPYPVDPRHPTPQAAPPPPGPGFASTPYPTHPPHPVPGSVPAPYPPVGAAPYPPYPPPAATPYPPAGPMPASSAPYPDYSGQPPSYSEAVSQPPVQPLPPKDGYSKQAPYNPNY